MVSLKQIIVAMSLAAMVAWVALHAYLDLSRPDDGILWALRRAERNGSLWWLGPFEPPAMRSPHEACPPPGGEWWVAVPVVGPLLERRHTAKLLECRKRIAEEVVDAYWRFSGVCLLAWGLGVVLVLVLGIICSLYGHEPLHELPDVSRSSPRPEEELESDSPTSLSPPGTDLSPAPYPAFFTYWLRHLVTSSTYPGFTRYRWMKRMVRGRYRKNRGGARWNSLQRKASALGAATPIAHEAGPRVAVSSQ